MVAGRDLLTPIISLVIWACRYRFQKSHLLVGPEPLYGPGQEGGEDSLADIRAGAEHLVYSERAPEERRQGRSHGRPRVARQDLSVSCRSKSEGGKRDGRDEPERWSGRGLSIKQDALELCPRLIVGTAALEEAKLVSSASEICLSWPASQSWCPAASCQLQIRLPRTLAEALGRDARARRMGGGVGSTARTRPVEDSSAARQKRAARLGGSPGVCDDGWRRHKLVDAAAGTWARLLRSAGWVPKLGCRSPDMIHHPHPSGV